MHAKIVALTAFSRFDGDPSEVNKDCKYEYILCIEYNADKGNNELTIDHFIFTKSCAKI